jgi:hypothetical protein
MMIVRTSASTVGPTMPTSTLIGGMDTLVNELMSCFVSGDRYLLLTGVFDRLTCVSGRGEES